MKLLILLNVCCVIWMISANDSDAVNAIESNVKNTERVEDVEPVSGIESKSETPIEPTNDDIDVVNKTEAIEESATENPIENTVENAAENTGNHKYNVTLVNKFVEKFQNQMKCGYPKFGIPPVAPLELAYRFKHTFDFLSVQKVSVAITHFVISGLDNFFIVHDNTSFTRTQLDMQLSFPQVVVNGNSLINKAKGLVNLAFNNIDLVLRVKYEDVKDILTLTNIEAKLYLDTANVNITNLIPISEKLNDIWNIAIGDSLPEVVRLLNNRKFSVEVINRLLSGFKYYALNIANNALNTYKLNYDGLENSLTKFTESTEDSLMCIEDEDESEDWKKILITHKI